MKTALVVRSERRPQVLELWQTAITAARVRAAQIPPQRPIVQRAEDSTRYVVRSERVLRPDGELWFHWWNDGRLTLSVSSATEYIEISLRHGDALAFMDFMSGVPGSPRDATTQAVRA